MRNIEWLIYRLKAMSILEIFYRIYKFIYQKLYKYRYRNPIKINEINKRIYDLSCVDKKIGEFWYDPLKMEITCSPLVFETLNSNLNLKQNINWHEGMYSEWNKNISSYDINTKYTDDIGDIRVAWENNRHQFLPYLAFQYIKTQDERLFETLESHFTSWIDNNPFLLGINWISPMEIAIRSYQWLITFYILKDSNKEEFRQEIINSIIVSMSYVSKNLSRFSSANNHLIIEAYILSIIGYSLEDIYKQNWFSIGYKILNKEIENQFYTDGINKEQALHYQAFVTDAMLQYNNFLKNIGQKTIHENIIRKSLEFIRLIKANELYIEFGDSDDAKIVQFSHKKYNYYEYILILGSYYYNHSFIEFKSSIQNEILFFTKGKEYIGKFNNNDDNKEIKLYEEGGYFVATSNEMLLMMDVGSLGFGSIAAHGHADALSIIYYYKTHPIFIDSGTYIYNIQGKDRNYFRSTQAHNTLIYNDENQSEIKGPFLWGKKAQVKILDYSLNNDEVSLTATHNGYNPFTHKRNIEYSFSNDILTIKDYFEEKCKINFILDEKCKIDLINENTVKIINNEIELYLESNHSIKIERCYISKKFLSKIETYKIIIEVNNPNIKYSLTRISPYQNYKKEII